MGVSSKKSAGKRSWDWSTPDGHSDGRPTTFTTQDSDGYIYEVTLQANEDGVLVCTGLNIQFNQELGKAPSIAINSRFFQLLGLGEMLASARQEYINWGEILEEIYNEMEIEREITNWAPLGNEGFPDKKYAAVAYKYCQFVSQGLENPITQLAEFMNCDKNTAASRVLESRRRGLLTAPKSGTYGGKLTGKAEKLLNVEYEKEKKKGKIKNAKKK